MERLFLGLGEREVEASFIEALACDLWFQPNPESVLALSHTHHSPSLLSHAVTH
jgi:hypothetical protein